MMTKSNCARWLQGQDNYLILTHRRPDGDTLGSAAFLCRMLRTMGKTAHILKNGEITPKYANLHQGLTVEEALPEHTLVCVDVASPDMIPESFRPLLPRISLRIDHHATADPFTPLALVEPEAAACGEILFDLMGILQIPMDKAMAEALYTAVSTDTGCFRYANTTAHSFLTAAACAQAGGDLNSINQAIFDTNSLARLRIQGWLVENARFYAGGKVAVCPLPKSVERGIGVTEDDMENISGFPRSIEGVQIAATLRETENGVKVSVRALPGFDAGAVCAQFGGGGHKGAAGASMKMSLEEAAQAVTNAILETVTP
ncbi:MAG: bifunctional oligoribonuclease/PAP phosphatase NrnA [Faecousia sp.]